MHQKWFSLVVAGLLRMKMMEKQRVWLCLENRWHSLMIVSDIGRYFLFQYMYLKGYNVLPSLSIYLKDWSWTWLNHALWFWNVKNNVIVLVEFLLKLSSNDGLKSRNCKCPSFSLFRKLIIHFHQFSSKTLAKRKTSSFCRRTPTIAH